MIIAIADIDHFKKINDTYGHDIGDEVLRKFAECTQSIMRKSDYFGRWGGEEWLLLFPDTDLLDIKTFFARLQKAVKHIHLGKHEMEVTFSMGAVSSTQYANFTEALSEADKLLYKAKNAGRDRLYTKDDYE